MDSFGVVFRIYLSLQTHEDYRALERAKEAMVDVAQYINEVKRDSDHLVIIQKVKVSEHCLFVVRYLMESKVSKVLFICSPGKPLCRRYFSDYYSITKAFHIKGR